ncbi:hypothetical protein D1AOALGA4SA_209, partial [Olavius algarvensis Delta 1 endosymbiont]
GIYFRSDFSSSTPDSSQLLIAGNDIYQNSNRAIYCYSRNYGRLSAEIRANRVYNNGGDGIYCDRGGMLAAGQQMAPVIVLNEIYQNGGHGVYC